MVLVFKIHTSVYIIKTICTPTSFIYIYIIIIKTICTPISFKIYIYNFTKKICTPTYYTQQSTTTIILENIHLMASILYFIHLRHISWCFLTLEMILLNGRAHAAIFTTVFQLYCCSPALLLLPSVAVVLQL